MLLRGTAAVALLCVSASALAQQPAAPAITGQVLAADADTPLRRARITVTAGPWRSQPVLTDNAGRFLVEVSAGGTVPYTVTVAKGGYVTAAAQVERKDIQTPVLARLLRGAAISGVAVDRNGAPVSGMVVIAARIDAARAPAAPVRFTTTTDDLGEYRLAGLSKGRYEVWAGTGFTIAIQPPTNPPARAPATLQEVGAGAKTIANVETAEELGGVQLVAPDDPTGEAILKVLREGGSVPPNSVISVISGNSGVLVDQTRAPGRATPPRGMAAALRGRVLSATRKPIPGATVRFIGPGRDERQLRTDIDGAFSLDRLRPGQYTLEASASGYMNWQFGQRAPGQAGRPITVATDQVVEGIELVLAAGRVIYGFVADEHGEPLEGARVQALQLRYTAGRLTPVPAGNPRNTDDKGRYRIWGLQPGSYLVAASVDGLVPTGSGHSAYARMYFPGTAILAAALPIDLREDATVNLSFAPTGLTDVRVVAHDRDAPLVSGTARLTESRRSSSVSDPRVADIEKDGSFVFRNVPPGDYVVQVRGDGPGRTGLFGTQELLVGAEPVRVTMQTSYGTGVEGRVIYEGDREGGSFRLRTVTLDDRARESTPDVTRRESTSDVVIAGSEFFTLHGLFGHTSFALMGAPGDEWYLKSWTINGTDIADTGYDFGARQSTIDGSEIVLSRNGAAISGRVDGGARPIDDYSVVVFPVSRELRLPLSRRMKFTRSTVDGTFRVAGLPPGDYFAAAVTLLMGTRDDGEWQNPDVLLQLEARAERISVSEGQTANVSLRLIER